VIDQVVGEQNKCSRVIAGAPESCIESNGEEENHKTQDYSKGEDDQNPSGEHGAIFDGIGSVGNGFTHADLFAHDGHNDQMLPYIAGDRKLTPEYLTTLGQNLWPQVEGCAKTYAIA
jgi:hypothetical protein